MDFLWHRVSEKEKEEIKKQARQILDDFSKKLAKIDKKIPEPLIERKTSERKEQEGKTDENFSKELMFDNAPEKNKDFIIGEKGKW